VTFRLAPNNVMFLELPIWVDILFVVFLCGLVILIPLVSLILVFLSQKMQTIKQDKLLRIPLTLFVFGASYMIYFILIILIYIIFDDVSRISSNIPGVILDYGLFIGFQVIFLGGPIFTGACFIGNLIWFLIRRKKILLMIQAEGKTKGVA